MYIWCMCSPPANQSPDIQFQKYEAQVDVAHRQQGDGEHHGHNGQQEKLCLLEEGESWEEKNHASMDENRNSADARDRVPLNPRKTM